MPERLFGIGRYAFRSSQEHTVSALYFCTAMDSLVPATCLVTTSTTAANIFQDSSIFKNDCFSSEDVDAGYPK